MVFNSAVFIFFFIIVLSLYWGLQGFAGSRLYQNRMLLLASYFFYGYWDWAYLGLILLSTVVDYAVGIGLDSLQSQTRRKVLITISVVLNLILLGIFKYYDFFIGSFASMANSFSPGAFPDGGHSLFLNAILPVGISFYTFQSMAYTIDVYRRTIRAERNFLDYALFVSFFPQLVAGPINRAKELMPQMKNRREFRWDDMRNGAWLILIGFFMKVYVADNLAPIVAQVYLPGKGLYLTSPMSASGHGGFQVFASSLAFSLQIYGDFAGYSSIALGAASMMGFRMMTNFNTPQFSQNPVDLWRRWHISLNRWVTDYIYIPLGGSQLGVFHKHKNLFLAFVLMGLWHGASWTFLIWGGFCGIWIVMYGILQPYLPRLPETAPPFWKATANLLKMAGTWTTFGITAIFFRAYDLDHSIALLKSLFTFPWNMTDPVNGVPAAGQYTVEIVKKIALLFLLDTAAYRTKNTFWIFDRPLYQRVLVYSAMFFMILTLGVFGKDVIYFAF